MQLLSSQKTLIYDLIVKQGFSPSYFKLIEFQGSDYASESTRISYNNTGYYISIFGSDSGYFYCECSPGEEMFTEKYHHIEWNLVIEVLHQWLEALRREINIVDKWNQLKTEMPNYELTTIGNEGKFTYEEVIQIENKIYLLKAKIKEIPLTTSQAQVLEEKLDYCIELAKTSSKFDWASYFFGVITNIIIALFITPDNAEHIWEAVKQVFTGFLLK